MVEKTKVSSFSQKNKIILRCQGNVVPRRFVHKMTQKLPKKQVFKTWISKSTLPSLIKDVKFLFKNFLLWVRTKILHLRGQTLRKLKSKKKKKLISKPSESPIISDPSDVLTGVTTSQTASEIDEGQKKGFWKADTNGKKRETDIKNNHKWGRTQNWRIVGRRVRRHFFLYFYPLPALHPSPMFSLSFHSATRARFEKKNSGTCQWLRCLNKKKKNHSSDQW